MFIETEGTPNPATLKFLPGREVMGTTGTADFASATSAARSPLAARIFALGGVARVFLGGDFITVTQTDDAEWFTLRPQVLGAIMDHFMAGQPVLESDGEAEDEEFDPGRYRDRRPDQGTAGHAGAPGRRRRWRRHRLPRLPRRRGEAAPPGCLLRLPLLARHAEARRREHAAALCAGGRGGRAGRRLIATSPPSPLVMVAIPGGHWRPGPWRDIGG